jgi:hypothetical protein
MRTRSPRLLKSTAMRALWTAAAFTMSLVAMESPLVACPAFLATEQIPALVGRPRSEIRLFALRDEASGPRWETLPLQIDALDETGLLVVPDEEPRRADLTLATHDRIAFRVEDFGRRAATPIEPTPCETSNLIELEDPSQKDRFAYLAWCPRFSGRAMRPAPVNHDTANHRVRSVNFEYRYLPENQLLWDVFLAKPPAAPAVLAVSKAYMLMHFDFRNFPTMDFGNERIESYVEHSTVGELGLVSRIQFYLRLLSFKIQLKMATIASFYADSAHIPMRIEIPMDSESSLNPAAGALFSWINGVARFRRDGSPLAMPAADPSLIRQGYAALAKQGLASCAATAPVCVFRVSGEAAGETVTIDMNIPRHLVSRGYFPLWVEDVHRFKKDLEWDEEPADAPRSTAIFMAAQGLPQGTHQIELWIRMNDKKGHAPLCPRAVNAVRSLVMSAAEGGAAGPR